VLYNFKDYTLLIRALNHLSKNKKNYVRLEFLGDSFLSFVIAEVLYKQYTDLAEGKLSQLISKLVKVTTLAQLASRLKM
ncbi:ribonuclease III, partial [Francisella tularensis subsp. holarctica]|uniref:ribonuclease III domain-containing protein n=1 Tax=Francisella tularensis TaxID=263 RepID=UPI002381CE09